MSGSAVVGQWRPVANSEWQSIQPRDYWAPEDVRWGPVQPLELLRLAYPELGPGNFKFDNEDINKVHTE